MSAPDDSGGKPEGLAATTPLMQPSSVPSPRRFAPGALLAGRYKVVKVLGEGGMGEVYEVEDLILHEHQALKCIRSEAARDDTNTQRFMREIQLARKVTHANVCRIFEVGVHGDIPFLTMELLEGETLAARIHRTGKIAPAEALPIVEQMAAALAAAHEAGIVHRDFKSPNVILARSGARAVVTDFGLARGSADGDKTALTGDGGVIGSPGYMAPEQVEGKLAVTPAVDIYALGVVMYEMVTGELPFRGESQLATMVMRLKEDPRPPRELVPALDERWQTTILRCLARDPAGRFATVAEVAAALHPPAGAAQARPRRLPALLAGGAIAAAVAVAAVALLARRGGPDAPAVTPAHGGKPSAAVVGFKNLSGKPDDAYLGPMFTELLDTELAAGEKITTVDGETVARARRDLDLPDTDRFAPATLARLRTRLGTDFVIVGSYVVSGGGAVHVELKLQDTRDGTTMTVITEDGGKDDAVKLASRLGEKLRAKLAVGALSPEEREGVIASLPSQPEAQRLYAEGVAQMRVEACSAARGPLEAAVALEPAFPLAHAVLAEALSCLALDDRAREEARKAVELAQKLPPEIRLAAEANLDFVTGAIRKARDEYAELFQRHPDNFYYGLRHLRTLGDRKAKEAAGVIAALRKLPGGDSAELDLIEAEQFLISGEPLDEAVKRFGRARDHAAARGERLVEASILLKMSALLARQGGGAQALEAAEKARLIFEAAADRDGVLQAMSSQIELRLALHDDKWLAEAQEQAQALVGGLENPRSYLGFLGTLAKAHGEAGDLAAAHRALEAGRAFVHQQGNHLAEGFFLDSLAYLSIQRGDLDAADAEVKARDAVVKPGTFPEPVYADAALLMARGKTKEAHAAFELDTSSLQEPTRSGVAAAFAALDALSDRRFADAETGLRALVMQQDARGGAPLDFRHLLIEALLAQGKLAEAQKELAHYTPDMVKGFSVVARLSYDLSAAEVTAASGKPDDVAAGEKLVADVIARADRMGLVVLRLTAVIALGRMEVKHGAAAAGQARLVALAREAGQLGFIQLANMATTLAANGGRF